MNEPTTYEELGELVRQGFDDWASLGDVRTVEYGDLILFNYTAMAQINNRWNFLERISRGLILQKSTGRVIARPFEKFFNYSERLPAPNATIVEATEKLDGSLGIIYCHPELGWSVATRGAFHSEQALWATKYLAGLDCGIMSPRYTYLAEIIYPDNRVVVRYGERQELCLLAITETATGREPFDYGQRKQLAEIIGFTVPQVYEFTDAADYLSMAETLSANEEGWVLKYSDGTRFKVKGTAYKLAHKLLSGLTPKRMVELLMADNGERNLYELLKGLPDEFYHEFKQMADKLVKECELTCRRIEVAHDRIISQVGKEDRKGYALAVQADYPHLARYMFAYKDGKAVLPIIYKSMLAEMKDTSPAVQEEV